VWGLTGAVTVFAAVVVVRLVWALGRVIIATGSRRRRHRDLVDLLGREDEGGVDGRTRGLRVLAEERPLAYCVPGLRDPRVVLSAGTVAMLSPDELAAVLAHERAHLRARHDLVLATFDAVHQAFPHAIRSELPAEQCRLLVEMLADDAAVRSVGPAPLGRALVALAGSVVPAGGLGAGPLSTRVRLERLAAPEHGRTGRLAAAVYLLAVSLVLAPVLAVVVTAS
jgi:Zn-dependent protease with chaperone function